MCALTVDLWEWIGLGKAMRPPKDPDVLVARYGAPGALFFAKQQARLAVGNDAGAWTEIVSYIERTWTDYRPSRAVRRLPVSERVNGDADGKARRRFFGR